NWDHRNLFEMGCPRRESRKPTYFRANLAIATCVDRTPRFWSCAFRNLSNHESCNEFHLGIGQGFLPATPRPGVLASRCSFAFQQRCNHLLTLIAVPGLCDPIL